MKKEDQLEVIKFLKSPEYQEVLKKYSNRFETKLLAFKTKYAWDNYKAGEPEYSENAMQSSRYKIFLKRIDDVKWLSRWAELVRKILGEQLINIESHYLSAVTNSFWSSKDIACFSEDDMYKYEMLHEKDFHIFIVGIMNSKEEISLEEKYSIYENPEEQLVD